jgi:hypothetical protein
VERLADAAVSRAYSLPADRRLFRGAAQRPARSDVLDALLPLVLERVREFVPDLVSYHSRDANPTGFCQCLQPRSYIDAIAIDVIRLGDHVAKVDPHSEGDALVLRGFRVAVSHCPLHLGGAPDGIHDTGELRQHSVAGVLHDAATVLRDLRIDQLTEMGFEPLVRPLLIRAHQTRVSGHVGGEDRCETADRRHFSPRRSRCL